MKVLKVLVVDDEKPARDRLRQILEDEDGVRGRRRGGKRP